MSKVHVVTAARTHRANSNMLLHEMISGSLKQEAAIQTSCSFSFLMELLGNRTNGTIFMSHSLSSKCQVNLMTVLILSRGNCRLSHGISCYMKAMATANLMVLVFTVLVSQIIRNHFPGSPLNYTPICQLNIFLQGLSLHLTVWFTITFTFDRFVAICCHKLKARYCTERMANVVITTVTVVNIMINIPLPFRYEAAYVANSVQWGCHAITNYHTSPGWAAHRWVTNISNSFVPIPLLLLMKSLTTRHILMASRARRALKSSSSASAVKMGSDPELKSRKTSIVLLFTISGCFVMLSAPITVIDVCIGVTQTVAVQDSNSLYLAFRVTFLMMCFSSCTNTCIYALTQRRFREEMKNLAKSPSSLLCKLHK
ncbi:probable G-protein coupled receptor 139 [Stegostoma tigrinum]|uniref:probable G-protein coupled receptor 139 n=1 Tax=Stegostoma tigrinum TaxID=3053191 RepID=UPI0028707DF7|nr:probable G-protein coupled receptor 139 [Stegostoma tigrinum]